jgi:putative hydrolase
MYNLHCHSLLSDGDLLPSELAVRYADKGYRAIAITDHVDYSNIKVVVPAILDFCRHWPKESTLKVFPGIEITHVPLAHFRPLVRFARNKGIKVIVGHGETPVEPVVAGTNRAALEARVDILAHPGQISSEDILLAKKLGVFLEITSRKGHSQTNSYVAQRCRQLGARLIINTDSHRPEDIISLAEQRKVALDIGLTDNEIDNAFREVELFLKTRR